MSVGERKVGLDSDLIPSHNLLSTILPLHSSGITCTLQPHYLPTYDPSPDGSQT
jgi:hypothetical protein